MRPWILTTVLGLCLVAYGCVSEGTKGCNQQNEQAGAFIEQDPTAAPETRQAGTDVKMNSQAMAKEIGAPKVSLPYTPANSEKLRGEIPTSPWWKRALNNIWTLIGTFVAGGGLMNLAGRFLPALAGPWGGIVTTLVTGIAKGRVAAEGSTDSKDAIKKMLIQLESELADDGYQGKVKALAKEIETTLDLDPKVTLR